MNPTGQDPMVAQMKNYLNTQGISHSNSSQQQGGDWYSQFQEKYQNNSQVDNQETQDTSLSNKTKAFIMGGAKGTGAELPLEGIDYLGRKAVDTFGSEQMKENLKESPSLSNKFEKTFGMTDNPDVAGAGEALGTIATLAAPVEGLVKNAPEILSKVGNFKPITMLKDLATPIETRIKNLLTNTSPEQAQSVADKLKTYVKIAKDSVGGNTATPYEIVGKNDLVSALKNLKTQMEEHGSTIGSTLEKQGATTVPVKDVINTAVNDAKTKLGVDLSGFEPGNIPGRIQKIVTGEDRKLLDSLHTSIVDLRSGNNSIQQIDDTLSNLNQALQASKGTGLRSISSPVQAVVKTFAQSLSDAQKSIAGEEFTNAKSSYGTLRGLYDRLNSKIGENGNQAASVVKQIFSPTNSTRSLVEDIQKTTGLPIFDNANLAHYAMKIAGDPRVESLLEQGSKISEGVSGVKLNEPGTWLKFISNNLQDPEGKALRILKSKGANIK